MPKLYILNDKRKQKVMFRTINFSPALDSFTPKKNYTLNKFFVSSQQNNSFNKINKIML